MEACCLSGGVHDQGVHNDEENPGESLKQALNKNIDGRGQKFVLGKMIFYYYNSVINNT